jgi:H+/Cl- antiporter ClcA
MAKPGRSDSRLTRASNGRADSPSSAGVESVATGAGAVERARHLGDFTVTRRVLHICGLVLPVGFLAALAAWCLLRLIGLFTNLFFYGRAATKLVAPGAGPHSWLLILCLPIAGGLVVGLMARFGSEKIRGHGTPEAIEAILTRGSRVEPRVAILKPISAAISIGSGGPFGAEGPIIMTGGAVGSVLAQHLELTADERKTLLVAGAAAGMAATFNAPLASVLLAVELLLFEWRPRSMLDVALHVSIPVYVWCAIVGVATGALGAVLTALVYAPRMPSQSCRCTGCGGRRSAG